ncbi:Nif11-like leader peptide family RiPP precursor [Anoxynatronum buryatiense]|uniref:Nif11-like leader peptide domain-containing protein n=1 Tax=Anoxynatronum buryatiense TaxID=489973 RepID=A0AA45WWD0_9CLOT|nr:Nif11-like leader peptide family RiPP precursor [Anoxynatronum buryatiense]SMP58028.1 nif11-like leader peptide domain-containing protein [Anoxynatronum buryatiense]
MEDKSTMLMKKLKEDPVLAEKLFSQETAEEAQTVLAAEGMMFNMEEIKQLAAIVAKSMVTDEEEISEEDLDNVAGGTGFEYGSVVFTRGSW